MTCWWSPLFYCVRSLHLMLFTWNCDLQVHNRCSKNVCLSQEQLKMCSFFYIFSFNFPEFKFRRFLLKHVVKGHFTKHKEEYLIGKQLFSPCFCWKFDFQVFLLLLTVPFMNRGGTQVKNTAKLETRNPRISFYFQ